MTPFEIGYYSFLEKRAFFTRLPTLSYSQQQEEEEPKPSWKECVEAAAKQVLGIEDEEPEEFGYGVLKTKPGDKQVAPPYVLQKTVDDLHKKWNTPGKKPDIVGAKTAEFIKSSQTRYTVNKGDVLSRIAKRYGVSVDDIMRENGISDPRKLRIGQVLSIPAVKVKTSTPKYDFGALTPYTVLSGDTAEALAAKHGVDPETLRMANNLPVGAVLKAGQRIVIPSNSFEFAKLRDRAVRKGESAEQIAGELGLDIPSVIAAYRGNLSKDGTRYFVQPGVKPDVSKLKAYVAPSYTVDWSKVPDAVQEQAAAILAFEDPVNYERILNILENRVEGDPSRVLSDLTSLDSRGKPQWQTLPLWNSRGVGILNSDQYKAAYSALRSLMSDKTRKNAITSNYFRHVKTGDPYGKEQAMYRVGDIERRPSTKGRDLLEATYRTDTTRHFSTKKNDNSAGDNTTASTSPVVSDVNKPKQL